MFREFTLKESFWFALTSFTPQGGGEAPKALSSRILVAAYWLFVVLMLATFTANLAAFLTVERMQVFKIILIKIHPKEIIIWIIINFINFIEKFIQFLFLVKNVTFNWEYTYLLIFKMRDNIAIYCVPF